MIEIKKSEHSSWFELDNIATEEMTELESLLTGLYFATSCTDDGRLTYDPHLIAPAISLARELATSIKNSMLEISEETRLYYKKTKDILEGKEVKAA